MTDKQSDQLFTLVWVLTGLIFVLVAFLVVHVLAEGKSGNHLVQEKTGAPVGARLETPWADELSQ